MSTPCKLLRSAPHHASKLSSFSRSQHQRSSLHKTKGASRCLATVHQGPKVLADVWFTGSTPHQSIPAPNNAPTNIPSVNNTSTDIPPPSPTPRKPNDERTVKLGKTLRILQECLPTLLHSPLPQEILSPQITLHLFPSTHPHLPTVSGRVAYSAALWTSPIAWGRVPLVGDVRLTILSERMVKSSPTTSSTPSSLGRQEQLIVRWRTIGKTKGKGTGAFYKGIGGRESVDKITEWLGGGKGEDDSKEFTGLFIFEFDGEGRVVSHTIEHVQEGGDWERGVGARVVGLTDWLLGGMRKRGDAGEACPACFVEDTGRREMRR